MPRAGPLFLLGSVPTSARTAVCVWVCVWVRGTGGGCQGPRPVRIGAWERVAGEHRAGQGGEPGEGEVWLVLEGVCEAASRGEPLRHVRCVCLVGGGGGGASE